MSKPCSKCGEMKEDSEFYSIAPRGKAPRLASHCKRCHSKYSVARGRTPAGKEYKRKWYAANKDRLLARFRARTYPAPTRPCPEGCEICGRPCSSGKRLALDHDHKTGEFRGWLCGNCNKGLGNFQDSKEILMRAINYVS